MQRKVYTVAWPSGLRRWFQAPVSSEAWVRIPPLPCVSFYKVNDSPILPSQIELFFSFFKFLFLLSLIFHQKRRLINNEKKKQTQTEILLFIEKRPPRRDKEKTQRTCETTCYTAHFDILTSHFKHNKWFFWKLGGVEGGLKVFEKMLQAVPASLFSEKDYTLLSIEIFFWKKGFKITFWLLFNSILRLRLLEWKVLLEV